MNQLKICFWNANGLSQHKHEVELFLQEQEIDVLLVSETHFTLKNCFRINGYFTYDTKHPSGRACGGTAVIVRRNIRHFPMPEFREEYIQATSINLVDFKVIISSVYCPPKHKIDQEKFLGFFSTLGSKFISAGDYNAKHTYWGSRLLTPRGRQLFNTITANKLDVISSGQPTYWPSDFNKMPDVIDFAVMKNIRRDQLSVSASLDLSSDHSPTLLTLSNGCVNADQNLNFYPNRYTNWLKYKMYVSSHLPQNVPLGNPDELQSAVNHFTEIMTTAVRVATPTNKSKKNKLLYPTDIQALVREKRRLRRQWQECRSPALKSQLNLCQTRLRAALKHENESALKNFLCNLDPTKKTDYSLWKAVRHMQCPIAYESPIRLENCKWAKNANEKVNAFANHLEKVFTPNDTSSCIDQPGINDTVTCPMKFRFATIKSAVRDLDTKKSPGADRITATMICYLPDSAMKMLMFIFNAILRLGFFPSSWKMSEIVMIPKPGKDVSQVTSYRPISLLSILSKLFEKLFLRSLTPYLTEHQIIPEHQFGFREKHSTIEQVHRITTLIRSAFENKQYCSALFIDISQAFDKVWHDGLIFKISGLLPENTHKLLQSYLSNRTFKVRSKDEFSSSRKISAGVPQGSILGPLLYIIYTADMPTNPNTHTSTFADDTAFVSINQNPNIASEHLQCHIYELENWLNKWRIKVNPAKCVHVTFTLRRQNCPSISINNVSIPEHNHVKYLGIHLDRRLTWSNHIGSKITQIKLKSLQLYWLTGPNSSLELEYKLLLYKSMIKPIWSYGIQLWGTACATNIQKLQRRQSKLLRLIVGAPWYIRNENIHKDLNIPTVQQEIEKYTSKYLRKLHSHPNSLARELLLFEGHRRLRRTDTLDLARLDSSAIN